MATKEGLVSVQTITMFIYDRLSKVRIHNRYREDMQSN